MNTIAPAITGTDWLSIVNLSMYPFQIAIPHNIPKRPTEAKPRIINPTQKRSDFSPQAQCITPLTSLCTIDKRFIYRFLIVFFPWKCLSDVRVNW